MNTYTVPKIGMVGSFMISLPRKLRKGAQSIETVMYIHNNTLQYHKEKFTV